MGFITSANTLTVTAKLTTIGRQKLLVNSSNLITHFALGDSDANYNVEYPLTTGEIPSLAGDLTSISATTGGIDNGYQLRSKLIRGTVSSTGGVSTRQNTKKPVETSSTMVVAEKKWIGKKTLSGATLTQEIIDRTNITGTAYTKTNLFKSFNLPITDADKAYFSTVTYPNGFKNTALENINQDKVLVINIPNEYYGELIDGKSLKLDITVSGVTADTIYTVYSTYQRSLSSLQTQDNNYKETSEDLKFKSNSENPQLVGYNKLGNNVSFLFCDDIAKPNQSGLKSWATGYDTFKPYSQNSKELFNLTTSSSISKTADTAVGIAYLDKGFIVITSPTIVNYFTDELSTATTVTFNSVSTEVSQKVTCIVNRGEFGLSTNPTFNKTANDKPRITEIVLLDSTDNIIAGAKLDRQQELPNDGFLALGVKIVV